MSHHRRFTRRDFVKTSTAAVAATAIAAPMIIPSSAWGANDRITLGFIGVGKQNGGHLNRMAGGRDTQVVAVCEVDKTRREHARKVVEDKAKKLNRKDFKGCDAYIDYMKVIERKDIDAVFIATPDHWHAILIIEACKEKHFIIDKSIGGPDASFSLDFDEFKQMVDGVRKVEKSLGKITYQLDESAKKSKEFSRSLFIVSDMKKG